MKLTGLKAIVLLVLSSLCTSILTYNPSFASSLLPYKYKSNAKDFNSSSLDEESPSPSPGSDEESSLWSQDNSGDPFGEDDFFKNNTKKKKKKGSTLLPHWGFGLGVAPTTIQVKSNTSAYNLKASNFVIKISYDKPIKKNLSLLFGGSLLPVNGSQVDSALGIAKFEANYTALEANGRFNFSKNPMHGPWVGAGASYLLISKGTSNVVASSSISSRMVYQANLGYNAQMGSEYLMFRADYYLYPEAKSFNGYVRVNQTVFSAHYFF